jgi:AP-1-like factor
VNGGTMNYTPYFAGAPIHHQLIPPTPSHSASDDLANPSPSTGGHSPFEEFPGNPIQPQHFQHSAFDDFALYDVGQPQHGPQQQALPPGPPTPPTQPSVTISQLQQAIATTQAEVDEQRARQGSNSEEDDATPAQAKRKAQNRAAQRAFRERKEKHVKDLEGQLNELRRAQQDAASENERLKRDLQKVSTENEILRATSSMMGAGPGAGRNGAEVTTTGPMTYNPDQFYTELLEQHPNKAPSHRIVTSENGQRLLAAGATWDYIVSHELYQRGLVDPSHVCNLLKDEYRCDGQGPVFEEKSILDAIQQSASSHSDELI